MPCRNTGAAEVQLLTSALVGI